MLRWRLLVLVLLLLLGAVAPGARAQFQPPPPRGQEGKPPPPPPFDRESLFNRLNLTSQQRTRLTALMNEMEEKMRQLMTRLHEQRMQLAKLYEQYDFDERAAQRLLSGIRHVQDEILKTHHEHQKQLRRILDKEQFERWKQWWRERMFFPPKPDWGRRERGKPG
ncbi:MAG: periplasmic heavy metal sensor [Chthonomonadetes bacterium]|nr:periplasmic heavy metal sensor [Chthonomonadetes bacterium]